MSCEFNLSYRSLGVKKITLTYNNVRFPNGPQYLLLRGKLHVMQFAVHT